MPYPIFETMKILVSTSWLHLFSITIIAMCCSTSTIHGQLMIPEKTELYRDDVVPRIDIIIAPESLDYILAPENRESDELFDATFIFDNGTVNDTLENIGFRLRGNTSRSANKKSFKINLNAFVPGRKYFGVSKINLNGQHNDPTSSRAKICADIADLLEIPSIRTNHVQLYINNNYYGLYTNTEHIDQNYVKKRFGNKNGNLYKCLYPADLNYKGNNPDSYKEIIYGRRNYELKNNQSKDDYTDFANFVKVLNLTSDANLSCELEKVFNVDQYLKVIIFDILTGNWDGPIYNKNNFYLYNNQATGKFEYIPFDLDNTLGIDWLNKDWGTRNIYEWSQTGETRPIYNRIMEVQEYRDRFSFYMQEVLLNVYNETELYPYLDDIRSKLKSYIENDTYYTLDYGFDIADFENGFEYELGYYQTDYGIKSFIQERLIAAFSQLELNDINPVITDVKNNYPNKNENIKIQAHVLDDQGIDKVEACFSSSGLNVLMFDDGQHNDEDANDGIYGVSFLFSISGDELGYTIKAVDNVGQVSTYPRCSEIIVPIEEEDLKLSINEFMASNNSIIMDEENEYDDWIELYNYGSTPIYLGDKFLSDNPDNQDKWSMPNYTIQGGEYLLFWADDDRNQGTFHTNFKLSKDGEHIGIYDQDESVIDQIEFNIQDSDISFGRIPNGTGGFISMTPTPNAPNMGVNNVENESPAQIIISPNPTYNSIKITSKEKITSVKLFDAFGRSIVLNQEGKEMDKINFPNKAGIYYIQVTTESDNSIIQKVIKL